MIELMVHPSSSVCARYPQKRANFLRYWRLLRQKGLYLEIGASAGYSALWIALACEILGRTLHTFELLPEKVQLARETFQVTQVDQIIRLVEGDVRDYLSQYEQIALYLLDVEKEIYGECYESVIPKLVKGCRFRGQK